MYGKRSFQRGRLLLILKTNGNGTFFLKQLGATILGIPPIASNGMMFCRYKPCWRGPILFLWDMLPEDERFLKSFLKANDLTQNPNFESRNRFGYHYQYSRNMLFFKTKHNSPFYGAKLSKVEFPSDRLEVGVHYWGD